MGELNKPKSGQIESNGIEWAVVQILTSSGLFRSLSAGIGWWTYLVSARSRLKQFYLYLGCSWFLIHALTVVLSDHFPMWKDSELCLQGHFVQSDGMEPKKVPCGTSECSLPSQRHCCLAGCAVLIRDLGSKEVIYSHPSNLVVRGKRNPPITTEHGLLKWDVEHVRECGVHTSVLLVSHSRVFIMCIWRSLVSSR